MKDKIRKIKKDASEYLRKAIVFYSEDLLTRFTKGNKNKLKDAVAIWCSLR
jgi:hypothetical protein